MRRAGFAVRAFIVLRLARCRRETRAARSAAEQELEGPFPHGGYPARTTPTVPLPTTAELNDGASDAGWVRPISGSPG